MSDPAPKPNRVARTGLAYLAGMATTGIFAICAGTLVAVGRFDSPDLPFVYSEQSEVQSAATPDLFVEMPGEAERKAAPRAASPMASSVMMDEAEADGFGGSAAGLGGIGTRAKRAERGRANPASPPAGKDAAGPTVRSWFPDTFLWRPLVETDQSGRASVEVRMPDTLTTWRVLGLAASRDGAQAGDSVDLITTLPVYAEPRLPDRLRAGDIIEMPIRLVNTTDLERRETLATNADGLTGGGAGRVRLAPGSVSSEIVRFTATRPGLARVSAALGDADASTVSTRVEPVGEPQRIERGGLLGDVARLELEPAEGATWARLAVDLYPGPLAALRRDLERVSGGGGGIRDRAFAYAVGVRAGPLLARLGAPPTSADTELFRTVRLRALQGLAGMTPSLGLPDYALVYAGVRGAPDAVAEATEAFMRTELQARQRPDGSWEAPSGTSLQQSLVMAAWICSLLDEPGSTAVTAGLFERNAAWLLHEETGDPWTAAWVLVSGAASESLAAGLRERLIAALELDEQGRLGAVLAPGTLRPDGAPVSEADFAALASLALADDTARSQALLASLLSRYRPGLGFGDAFTGFVALDALDAFKTGDGPQRMQVLLRVDGEDRGSHTFETASLAEPALLQTEVDPGRSHEIELVPSGSWPGLAWRATLESRTPWTRLGGGGGLDIAVEQGPARVAEPLTVQVTVSGPESTTLTYRHPLPAGVRLEPDSLEGAVVVSGSEDEVVATVRLGPGGLVRFSYVVVPGFAGRLQAGPVTATVLGRADGEARLPPETWTIR